MRILFWGLVLLYSLSISAQSDLIQSGPMIGYVDMREALVWVQTTRPAEVQIRYRELGGTGNAMLTRAVRTTTRNAHVAKLVANQVQPGKTYRYEVLIDGNKMEFPYPTLFQTQQLWQWRTDPPDFTVAVGSCMYVNEPRYDRPGNGYGSEFEIFTSINEANPDLMLWLGDNTYLREADWWTRTGIMHRHTHTRSLPELQPLLARTPNYAIWDDHDFGPNDSDRSWINKEVTKEAFDLFWGNPSSGLPGQEGGITSMFQFNDVDVFLLDNRYFRSPNDLEEGEKTILGEYQFEWLIDALVSSNAAFKLVCIGGQVLNTAARYENYANVAPDERAKLLRRIEEEGIRNVVFLSGDRHHSEMSQLELADGIMVHELTASSLTSGTGRNRDEVNENRVEGSLIVQHNFGILEVTGPREARRMRISIKDAQGRVLWAQQIEAQ